MLKTTKNMLLPTAIVGSYPRPVWCTESLRGRAFKQALGDSLFREQYVDTVTCVINAQESAGLDILTDGDARFDLAVGGKSWFFYVIERLNDGTPRGLGDGEARRPPIPRRPSRASAVANPPITSTASGKASLDQQ